MARPLQARPEAWRHLGRRLPADHRGQKKDDEEPADEVIAHGPERAPRASRTMSNPGQPFTAGEWNMTLRAFSFRIAAGVVLAALPALAASAVELPTRKAGLWELK